MICPECGGYSTHGSACDSGEPYFFEGTRCPHCGMCIGDGDWIEPDETNIHAPRAYDDNFTEMSE